MKQDKLEIDNMKKTISPTLRLTWSCSLILLMTSCASQKNLSEDRIGFESADAAVSHVIEAMGANKVDAIESCLGPDCQDILSSGDPIADQNGRAMFVKQFNAMHKIAMRDLDTAILHVGSEDWPLPIPIVRQGEAWYFDTEAGREEVINRRVGRQELDAIQVCLALSDAQREYSRVDWDGDGVYVYAQKLRSTDGMKDGLSWKTGVGERPSPMGEFAAEAEAEGYDTSAKADIRPYHGYYFRLLNAQGENAMGGAYSYMANDLMIGGFAVIAWPANYGVTGVKSFLVNHEGVVFECDLGDDTAAEAAVTTAFNPDSNWTEVDAPDLEPLN
ncbi:MAG: hypothetical protein ACI97A_001056 [Planctomycetota bacterium]|jgi:hypothetical protein